LMSEMNFLRCCRMKNSPGLSWPWKDCVRGHIGRGFGQLRSIQKQS
jgi:hypothetical protein